MAQLGTVQPFAPFFLEPLGVINIGCTIPGGTTDVTEFVSIIGNSLYMPAWSCHSFHHCRTYIRQCAFHIDGCILSARMLVIRGVLAGPYS